jgi:hypothetical protein
MTLEQIDRVAAIVRRACTATACHGVKVSLRAA